MSVVLGWLGGLVTGLVAGLYLADWWWKRGKMDTLEALPEQIQDLAKMAIAMKEDTKDHPGQVLYKVEEKDEWGKRL